MPLTHSHKLHDRYVLESLLGKGGFSEVWKAYDLPTRTHVAVKIHALDSRWSDPKKESYTKHVSREYDIHRSVRHPNVIGLLDVFEIDQDSFATVLELCPGGLDLDVVLKQRGFLPEAHARAILLQLVNGLHYLHSQPAAIIHFDLKPANVLLHSDDGRVQITDFGLSKLQEGVGSMDLTSPGAGTYWYLPPECFGESPKISPKVDVWSLGVVWYQMLYGQRPFGHGVSQEALYVSGALQRPPNLEFPKTPVVSAAAQRLLQACMAYEPSQRPSMTELRQDPYMVQDWIV